VIYELLPTVDISKRRSQPYELREICILSLWRKENRRALRVRADRVGKK
jgi:hypothetical protein